jgi:hypothetical protein
MNKENVVYLHNGILFIHRKQRNHVLYSNMDGNRNHMFSETSQTRKTNTTYPHSFMETNK